MTTGAPDQGSSTLQDFVLAFNACQSPKEALQLIQGFADKVLTVLVSVSSDNVQLSCTSLAGSLLEECILPMEATLAELEAKIDHLLFDSDIPVTCVTFLDDNGSAVNKDDCLQDHTRLTVKASLSPADVGRLMYQAGDSISVQMLGQCLGHHGEFWKQLAMTYPENFACFAGMDIVVAIRAYLWRFRLPGEAAQIERIVDGFAHSYFRFNSTEGQGLNEKESTATLEEVSDNDSDDDDEVEQEDHKPEQSHSAWDAGVMGWYVHQPFSGPKLLPCCTHCGVLDDEMSNVVACRGCDLVHFCRRCRRNASRYGHAVVGQIGYGRACVAAKRAAGSLGPDRKITYLRMNGKTETSVVPGKSMNWGAGSPFRTEDSVMVLAYAIIMLTTNLHSVNVRDKMKKHEFISQNRQVNGGANFPGDFLAQIYDDIQQEELKVMRN